MYFEKYCLFNFNFLNKKYYYFKDMCVTSHVTYVEVEFYILKFIHEKLIGC